MAALFGPKCMNILVMGGTRFVGRPLVARLQAQGHALTLFTRGRNPVPAGVEHLCGDRSSDEGLSALQGRSFDVIVDSSGRKQEASSRVVAHNSCMHVRRGLNAHGAEQQGVALHLAL